jgi:SAM-dependent methyltransferase
MMDSNRAFYRGWEYKVRGDYHRNLDPNWSYTPTYLRKAAMVFDFIRPIPKHAAILDACCGEGVFVEQLRSDGWNIKGIDLNYESNFVTKGNVTALQFANESHAAVLFLDALEHLAFDEQPKALHELFRVLQSGGKMLVAVPNMAHFNSRVQFASRGALDRTDVVWNHVGERPIWENKVLIEQAGFVIDRIGGITLTLPYIYRGIVCRNPAKYKWLHDVFEPLAMAFPSLAMVSVFYCRKP